MPDAAVERNFGFNDRGTPTLGAVLAGEGDVLAAGSGEVIFYYRPGRHRASRFPSPLGAWTAVEQDDDFVGIYARHGDDGGPAPLRAERGRPIAPAGISGWSSSEGGFFMIFDRRLRHWVNPSQLVSPHPDAVAPQIHGAHLLAEDGGLFPLVPGQTVAQGRFGVLVNATDALSYGRGSGLAPHRITVSVNGREAGTLSLETISARNGVALVNRGAQVPARRVYANAPAFEAADVFLSRGLAAIEIIVRDAAGNESGILVQISVE